MTCSTASTWRTWSRCGCGAGALGFYDKGPPTGGELPAPSPGDQSLRSRQGSAVHGGAGRRSLLRLQGALLPASSFLHVPSLPRTYAQWECPHYGEDPRGTHVRCYFDVTGLFKDFHFLVKGASRGSSIPCSELYVDLMESGELGPRAPDGPPVGFRGWAFLRWLCPHPTGWLKQRTFVAHGPGGLISCGPCRADLP